MGLRELLLLWENLSDKFFSSLQVTHPVGVGFDCIGKHPFYCLIVALHLEIGIFFW